MKRIHVAWALGLAIFVCHPAQAMPVGYLAPSGAQEGPAGGKNGLRNADIAKMTELAGRTDRSQRLQAMDWLLDPSWGGQASDSRVRVALQRVALEGDLELARGWRLALATWDSDLARDWVEREISRGDEASALEVVGALQANKQNAALIRRLASRLVDPSQANALAVPIAVELLPLYARTLVDAAPGELAPADVAPIVAGFKHADIRLARAAFKAFEDAINRLNELNEDARTERVLAVFLEGGVDARLVLFEQALSAFSPRAQGVLALSSARALRLHVARGHRGLGERGTAQRAWRFRAMYLAGLAQIALGDSAGASEDLLHALRLTDHALRGFGDVDIQASDGTVSRQRRSEYLDLLQERVLALIAMNLAAVQGGEEPGSEPCLQRAREAHRLHMQGQALFAGLRGIALGGWDSLFDGRLSPYRLLFHGRRFEDGLSLKTALDMEFTMARCLASVAPLEMPGFEPYPVSDARVGDPLLDPDRRDFVAQIQMARLDRLVVEMDVLGERIGDVQSSPGTRVPEAEIEVYTRLERQRRILLRRIEQGESGDRKKVLLDLRVPGRQALRLARGLRAAGEMERARDLVRSFKKDLSGNGISDAWYYLGQERLAAADLELGSNLSDADKPLEAQRWLEAGTERLQGIVERLKEAGAGPDALRPYQDLLAGALVSLAVHANVRLGQPDKALAYYERAYRLKQGDFMRVLLACYRARSGKESEARSLLNSVAVSPPLYYNLACTHALLGDRKEALFWLGKELGENHREPASLLRQKAWAAQDPDLVSLREDAAFRALIGTK
ncbi:MAG: tetratricopeptide (TPR) repeat protein [Glaciecola sp.]